MIWTPTGRPSYNFTSSRREVSPDFHRGKVKWSIHIPCISLSSALQNSSRAGITSTCASTLVTGIIRLGESSAFQMTV